MNLLRSSYYYKPKDQEISLEEQTLENRIDEITEEFPKYGYLKVTGQFHREDNFVSHKKVYRIMRENSFTHPRT